MNLLTYLLTLTLARTHSHSHTHSHSRTHFLTHSFTRTHTHTHTHALTHTHSLPPLLTHSHSHTPSLPYSLTLTRSLTHPELLCCRPSADHATLRLPQPEEDLVSLKIIYGPRKPITWNRQLYDLQPAKEFSDDQKVPLHVGTSQPSLHNKGVHDIKRCYCCCCCCSDTVSSS